MADKKVKRNRKSKEKGKNKEKIRKQRKRERQSESSASNSLEHWQNEMAICVSKISDEESKIAMANEKLLNLKKRLENAKTALARIDGGTSSASAPNTDIIRLIGSITEPPVMFSEPPLSNHVVSGYRNKLKCLLICPKDSDRILTSSQDGIIKHWKLISEGNRLGVESLSQMNAMIVNRWPEDVSWDPIDERVVTVYDLRSNKEHHGLTAVAVSKLDSEEQFQLVSKHGNGGALRVSHMVWGGFVTAMSGSSKRPVVLWMEGEGNNWTETHLHTTHSNDVLGIVGLKGNKRVITVGKDMRLVGFDCGGGGGLPYVNMKFDVPLLGIASNPQDVNLMCIYANSPGSQIRLVDHRMTSSEAVMDVWKSGWTYGLQQASQTQSSLVSQSWSPCGRFIASGSGENTIQLFDIRRNGKDPILAFKGNTGKVYRAIFHPSRNHLISIGSDYFIGVHDFSHMSF